VKPIRIFAATGDAVAQIDTLDGHTLVTELNLEGRGVTSVAVDPRDPDRVFAGTFDRGIYRTRDGGENWESVGAGMSDARVPSLAISPIHQENGLSVVYAGTEPSRLLRSDDDGATWHDSPTLVELPSAPTWSFPPRPWTHHTRWIALHPTDPATIYVGIELGGVMITRDGGATWEDRKPGAQDDAHAIATHPAAPERVYEAAGGGVAISHDAGRAWIPADEGMDRHYAWGLAIDAADPDLWYVSASFGAHLAHRDNGSAEAIIYRKRGDSPWQALGGDGTGLDQPLNSMPYALLAPREQPNVLIAGLKHGDLLITEDAGDSWRRLQTGLPHLMALSESVHADQ